MIPRNGKRQHRYAPRRAHQRSDPRKIARAVRELAYPVQELPLRPGYCAHCRVIRLSRADAGEWCMFCLGDLGKQVL